jgi:hypothetical protein
VLADMILYNDFPNPANAAKRKYLKKEGCLESVRTRGSISTRASNI